MDLLVDQITWSDNKATVSGPASISTGFLYNTPMPVPQPAGPPLRGNESHRVFSVSAYGGHLYVVKASGPCQSDCGMQAPEANNLFYWFDIDAKTMTLSQNAKVSDPTLSLLFPTIGAGRPRECRDWGHSSFEFAAPFHLSVYAPGTDSTGKLNGPFLAQSGTESYTCNKGRDPATVGWGTYSGTVQDGSDPMKLWTLQKYAGSATPCVWKTRVVGFQMERGGTRPPKPQRVKME